MLVLLVKPYMLLCLSGFTMIGVMRKLLLPVFAGLLLVLAAPAFAAPKSSAPSNTSAPSLKGKAYVGYALSVKPGRWSGYPKPKLTYQWYQCESSSWDNCERMASETEKSIKLVESLTGKFLAAEVTATNSYGKEEKRTGVSSKIAYKNGAPPTNPEPPVLKGKAIVGYNLSATPGKWAGAPSPTLKFQWQRCSSSGSSCADIVGKTERSITLTDADIDKKLRLQVTATNKLGSEVAYSPLSAVVVSTKPVMKKAPEVKGTPTVGKSVSVRLGTWSGKPSPALAINWMICTSTDTASCNKIVRPNRAGETGTNYETESYYTVATGDAGKYVAVQITATNSYGSASAISTPVLVTRPAS